jgi:hypothetical protein
VDVSIDPARFIVGVGANQVLEDEITGWGVTALRVRP